MLPQSRETWAKLEKIPRYSKVADGIIAYMEPQELETDPDPR